MLKRRRRIPTPRAKSGPPAEAWITPATTDLFKTIAALKSPEEAERFFRDLCTIPELHTLAHRWEVAKLLDQGVHYADIAQRTGASTATITRINSWRRFGTGGYRLLLDRRKARAK
jgi:TrpR-related protein YerC/YecD